MSLTMNRNDKDTVNEKAIEKIFIENEGSRDRFKLTKIYIHYVI